ncbi:hypothetical protein GE061_013759 [Apolygus lucorum]|uniref:Uncharacterized protein n=1 Tax=Apolygus lucorum TaxID=248454 RepID=A0A6A4JQL7_APOLU|nr:hypothetical protein GE061_013759 [Apolygus lucorum]
MFIRSVYTWIPTYGPNKYFPYEKLKETIKIFYGNASYTDFFILLGVDVDSILIGSRDVLFNISLANLTENVNHRLRWPSTAETRGFCEDKGLREEVCHNFIRVAAMGADGILEVCGTNSYKPLCRRYRIEGNKFEHVTETSGVGKVPHDPSRESTVVLVDGVMYSATFADLNGTDPVIYRQPVRTEMSNSKQLKDPKFIDSVSENDQVYFFFRESAIEYENCGKIVYSRVARVCKKDQGGSGNFENRWTTFMKARLNCSIRGEYPFYFNELQAISIVDTTSHKTIYGIFTTPSNSIGGSAVCAFSFGSFHKVFSGDYKGQETEDSEWLSVPENDVPTPRPGKCRNNSKSLNQDVVNFIHNHSLMDAAVLSRPPLFIKLSSKSRFVSITVDPQVKTVNGNPMDVFFMGTDDGRLFKGITRVKNVSIFSEELELFPKGVAIKTLKIARTSPPKLVVITNDYILTIPLHRCSDIGSCLECVGIQDPYCAWDPSSHACLAHNEVQDKANLVQDVLSGVHKSCPSALGGADSLIVRNPFTYFSMLTLCSFLGIIDAVTNIITNYYTIR